MWAAVVGSHSCLPDCAGIPYGVKVADPFDCTQYYYCSGDGTYFGPFPCNVGEYFNPDLSDCAPMDPNDPCEVACVEQKCHLTCDSSNDKVGDLSDCNAYYKCTVTGPSSVADHCPHDTPYFDGEFCGTDPSLCCSALYCSPYCDEDSPLQIPDQFDCEWFYVCEKDHCCGPPGEDYHRKCNEGSTFDQNVNTCVAGAECQALCMSQESTPSTTPSTASTTPSTPQPSTTTPSNCQTYLTCPGVGYFAKCNNCNSQYFQCLHVGDQATVEECVGDLVFNPVPTYPACIDPSECPFYPFL